jgi:hypothetical protein
LARHPAGPDLEHKEYKGPNSLFGDILVGEGAYADIVEDPGTRRVLYAL